MDLFRAPHLNAQDYLSRISEAASCSFGNANPPAVPNGNRGKARPATRLNSNERPFFQAKGEPLSAEVLYLKLHLLETLATELLPQGESLAHPQIPQTLDRVWLRADHQLSHVPYFWRFSLDWLEPATTPIPTDAPQSGMAYCLNALALIWQSVFEFDENKGRQTRKNSGGGVESPESETGVGSPKPASAIGHPTSSWQKKIIQEAMQIGNALSQAARGEIPSEPAAFLDPIERLKNRLWERIFNPAPSSAQPEAFPAELQAALHQIADRWEENLAEDSSTPEATETVEESPPAEEESIPMEDDGDDEFITETIVMSAPEDTARLELEEAPKPGREAASDESTPSSEPDDSLAETLALRDHGQPLDSDEASPEPAPKAPDTKEDALAETVALKDGRGTKSDSHPTAPHSLDSPSKDEHDLAETFVLKDGGGPPPPRPPETPERPPDEEPNLAETVALRTGGERRPESPPRPSETSAPPSDPEHDLAETVVLKNGGGHRPDSSPQQTETPGPPPDGEPGLAETVVLLGSDTGKNGRSHVPPPTNPPEPPDKEADDLAATVIVRPGQKTSAKPETMDGQPTAPENETESSDSLTETVILRPGRNRGKERS